MARFSGALKSLTMGRGHEGEEREREREIRLYKRAGESLKSSRLWEILNRMTFETIWEGNCLGVRRWAPLCYCFQPENRRELVWTVNGYMCAHERAVNQLFDGNWTAA